MNGSRRLEEADPDQERMEQVQAVYEASHKTYGYRRITIHLQQKQGICINHKAVLRLMRKLGIRSEARKPKMHKKLEEIGTYHRYPNVLNRDFVATDPTRNGSPISPTFAPSRAGPICPPSKISTMALLWHMPLPRAIRSPW